MATFTTEVNSVAVPREGIRKSYVVQNDIDLADLASTPVSTDIIQCLNIPAKTLVSQVTVEVIRAATGTALTFDTGDGVDPNGWGAGFDATAVAGTMEKADTGTDAYATANDKLYSAADTIDIVLATVTAVTNFGKYRVSAVCHDLSS